VLLAFAEHVSLAVTDANTLEAMHQAFHDSLTGLASRALFLDRLAHALARSARRETGAARTSAGPASRARRRTTERRPAAAPRAPCRR
jgi:hypothetical protein